MTKLGIGIAAMWLATTAGAEELCVGTPAASARHSLTTGSVVIGKLALKTVSSEPDDRRVMTCGGGVNADGDTIKPWDCFVQEWRGVRLGDGRVTVTLRLYFSREDGAWELANGTVTFPSGQRLPFPLMPCELAAPTSATELGI